MHLNNTKFERNSSLEYYHMTCIGKQNIQAKEVYWNKRKFSSRIYRLLSFMSLQGGSTLRSNPFYTAFLTEKVPLSYAFLSCLPWKMVRLLHLLKPVRETSNIQLRCICLKHILMYITEVTKFPTISHISYSWNSYPSTYMWPKKALLLSEAST